MKIAYISERQPQNINAWSGTSSYVYNLLSKYHNIEWVGRDIAFGSFWHHVFLGATNKYYIQDYGEKIGKIISMILRKGHFDIAISTSYTFCSHLEVDIPIIYFTDASFSICQGVFFDYDKQLEEKALRTERAALERADKIILCSDFVKQSFMSVHGIQETKIELIDFGANIPDPQNIMPEQYDDSRCNLVFVGRDWDWKGGQKVLDAYKILRQTGFKCRLTIIGCSPKEAIDDQDVKIVKWIDKAKQTDLELYDEILRHAHFMVLPTKFDAYGIVFCEASAYGVPSIAANVGGVSQPIKEDYNGYLLSPDATAEDYASVIRATFEDKELYRTLRVKARHEYETRLNWIQWTERVNRIMADLVFEYQKQRMIDNIKAKASNQIDYYIPVYAFNLKDRPDRLDNLKRQFAGRSEFDVTYMEAVKHERGNVGLWKSICNAIILAQKRGEDIIVLCEDDHVFTESYDKDLLFSNIAGAYKQGTELLNCGIGGFGNAVPVSQNRSWVDWFWCTQFIVVFAPLFGKILNYDFKDNDTADGVLSKISSRTMALYPIMSTQLDCGYSDIIQRAGQSAFQKSIFSASKSRLKMIHGVYQQFNRRQELKNR